LAVTECLSFGSKKHASEKWIKMHHMEAHHDLFDPICPQSGCCETSTFINDNLVCSEDTLAKSFCNSTTCTWEYACETQTQTQTYQASSDSTQNVSPQVSRKYQILYIFSGFCLGIFLSLLLGILLVKVAKSRRVQRESV